MKNKLIYIILIVLSVLIILFINYFLSNKDDAEEISNEESSYVEEFGLEEICYSDLCVTGLDITIDEELEAYVFSFNLLNNTDETIESGSVDIIIERATTTSRWTIEYEELEPYSSSFQSLLVSNLNDEEIISYEFVDTEVVEY